jgi:hypothetical protein
MGSDNNERLSADGLSLAQFIVAAKGEASNVECDYTDNKRWCEASKVFCCMDGIVDSITANASLSTLRRFRIKNSVAPMISADGLSWNEFWEKADEYGNNVQRKTFDGHWVPAMVNYHNRRSLEKSVKNDPARFGELRITPPNVPEWVKPGAWVKINLDAAATPHKIVGVDPSSGMVRFGSETEPGFNSWTKHWRELSAAGENPVTWFKAGQLVRSKTKLFEGVKTIQSITPDGCCAALEGKTSNYRRQNLEPVVIRPYTVKELDAECSLRVKGGLLMRRKTEMVHVCRLEGWKEWDGTMITSDNEKMDLKYAMESYTWYDGSFFGVVEPMPLEAN